MQLYVGVVQNGYGGQVSITQQALIDELRNAQKGLRLLSGLFFIAEIYTYTMRQKENSRAK